MVSTLKIVQMQTYKSCLAMSAFGGYTNNITNSLR